MVNKLRGVEVEGSEDEIPNSLLSDSGELAGEEAPMKPTRKQRSVAFEEMAAAMDKLDAELEALTERLASMSPEERRTYLEAINASWIAIVQKKEQLAALMSDSDETEIQ